MVPFGGWDGGVCYPGFAFDAGVLEGACLDFSDWGGFFFAAAHEGSEDLDGEGGSEVPLLACFGHAQGVPESCVCQRRDLRDQEFEESAVHDGGVGVDVTVSIICIFHT